MRIGPETLFVFLGVAVSLTAPGAMGLQTTGAGGSGLGAGAASPTPTPTPSPTPAARLVPYWYETEDQRSVVPMLRFEDRAEVRALEMNAAIARFFDYDDDKGNMLRGATYGGAPTLKQMGPYRPHATEGLNFLGILAAVKELGKQTQSHKTQKGEEVLRALLLATASPTPTPSPSPSPTPSPSPSPGRASRD